MARRSWFPKAKPTRVPRKRTWKPAELRTHVLIYDGTSDWDGVAICADCGFRRDHRVHDLNQNYTEEASEVDARRLGESE